jgi:hypothetical protein
MTPFETAILNTCILTAEFYREQWVHLFGTDLDHVNCLTQPHVMAKVKRDRHERPRSHH